MVCLEGLAQVGMQVNLNLIVTHTSYRFLRKTVRHGFEGMFFNIFSYFFILKGFDGLEFVL